MDNLGAHRPKRVRELIERRGCELSYLPSYSPDYDPIFTGARTREMMSWKWVSLGGRRAKISTSSPAASWARISFTTNVSE
jgi:hypothetical protein